jgi:hypothetical protein
MGEYRGLTQKCAIASKENGHFAIWTQHKAATDDIPLAIQFQFHAPSSWTFKAMILARKTAGNTALVNGIRICMFAKDSTCRHRPIREANPILPAKLKLQSLGVKML